MYTDGKFLGKNCLYNNNDHLITAFGNQLKFSKLSFSGGRTVINDDTPPNLDPFEFPITA